MAFPKPFYRWRPHPWHGLEPGDRAPEVVTAYIELTPFDPVKYEVDKTTGYLRVDRPQRNTSRPPHLYGFIPRTFCGTRCAALSPKAVRGDGDPLDIFVVSERAIDHSDIILDARVVGGMRMVDDTEADDKIIAVLAKDNLYSGVNDISEIPEVITDRLYHYLTTYKMKTLEDSGVIIDGLYGREEAFEVVRATMADYSEEFGD